MSFLTEKLYYLTYTSALIVIITYDTVLLVSRRQAVMCILADDCDEAMYKKLVIALCTEHEIPLLKVDNNKKLGEWAGLCKIDKEGKARKVVRCSCVVIKVNTF